MAIFCLFKSQGLHWRVLAPACWFSGVFASLISTNPCVAQTAQTDDPRPDAVPVQRARLNVNGPLDVSFGAKLWSTAWNTWVTSPKGTGVAVGATRFQTVQAVGSENQPSLIPYANLHVGDLSFSVSAMARTHYTLHDTATPNGFDAAATRQELDFNAGYYVLPSLTVYAAGKQLTQTYGPDVYRWRGPLLGLNGSAHMARGWAVYGNTAIGRMQAKFPESQADVNGQSNFNADYRLGEVGLAYATPWSGKLSTKSMLLLMGYRAQYVSTKRYGLARTDTSGNQSYNTSANLIDTTQGFILALTATF